MSKQYLLVDDEQVALQSLITWLQLAEFDDDQITALQSPNEAWERLLNDPERWDVVVADQFMDEMRGTSLFRRMVGRGIKKPIRILRTGFSPEAEALQAQEEGTVEAMVTKPSRSADPIFRAVDRAFRNRLMSGERKGDLLDMAARVKVIGGEPTRQILEKLWSVAQRDVNVLLRGPSGVGKSLLAHAFHLYTGRPGNFVAAGLTETPATLIESTLYGHVRGAFAEAKEDRAGRFETAHGGTIFLDELGAFDTLLQAKLLNVLQNREIYRLGSANPIPVDVRVISATNEPIEERLANGAFREDLYYRVAGAIIEVPPLAQRMEELEIFATHIAGMPVEAEALEQLMDHHWPGNIRELENVIKSALTLGGAERDGIIRSKHIAEPLERARAASRHVRVVDENTEEDFRVRTQLMKDLARFQGNVSKVSAFQGVNRKTIQRRCKKFGINVERYRRS